MEIIILVLILIVALLHIYFMVLEMFFWTKSRGLQIFGQNLEKAKNSAALAANQGLYNGFLASGLIWSLLISDPVHAYQNKIFFLVCVCIAGIYGAFTVSRKIFFVQALPALVALALLFLRNYY